MADWKNRIVGHGEESPEQLLANPKNWRTHPKEQREALAGALQEVGFVQSVIVNRTTGHLVDGHLRVELALERSAGTIPVAYVELTEEEEDLVLTTLDPIGALAGIDAAKLKELIETLNPDTDGLRALVAKLEGELGLDADGDSGEPDVETLLDQAVQLQPGREFVVIVCDEDGEFEQLRFALGLGAVRRGGYKPGSPFDATGVQRVVKARDLLEKLEVGSC
jgi:hypothetical protein